jgi:hypothetical protein
MTKQLNIPSHLLWEYDISKFNFETSYKIVIERVLQRGNLEQWRNIFHYYGIKKMEETIEWSAQLDKRDKHFSRLFLKSDLVNVV